MNIFVLWSKGKMFFWHMGLFFLQYLEWSLGLCTMMLLQLLEWQTARKYWSHFQCDIAVGFSWKALDTRGLEWRLQERFVHVRPKYEGFHEWWTHSAQHSALFIDYRKVAALLKITKVAADSGLLSILALLDPPAAFDTISHNILWNSLASIGNSDTLII